MTSVLNRFFNNFFPNLWPFSALKRARELEENEENIDCGISPRKKMKINTASHFPSRILRESNQPTVTTVRGRKTSLSLKKPVNYSFQPLVRKTNKPPSFQWSEVYSVDDDEIKIMPKHRSCSASEQCRTKSCNTTDSTIDLTGSGSWKSADDTPCIVIDDDDLPESTPNGRTRKGSRSSSRRNSESWGRSNSISKVDLTQRSSSSQRRRPHQLTSPEVMYSTWRSLERGFEERISFGKLLGTYVQQRKLPPPKVVGEVIDLVGDDDDDNNTLPAVTRSPRPSASENSHLNKTYVTEKLEDSVVSSSTKKGVKKEVMRVNSFESKVKENPYAQSEWLDNIFKEYKASVDEFKVTKEALENQVKLWDEVSKKNIETLLEEKLTQHLRITEALIPEAPADPYPPIIRPLPELTPEMEEKVRSTYTKGSNEAIIINKYGYTIKKLDIRTLHGLNWLNDEVINFYMVLINERSKSLKDYPLVHTFSTFFYTSLESRGYVGVKRWTRKVDLFEHDIIIIPIHLRVHWCLLCVDLKKNEINYYDSMAGNNYACLNTVANYLEEEHRTKKGSELDLSDWKRTNVKDIPQQMNGSDCGVFACTYAEYCARRAPFDFGQSKMPYFRRKMIYEIMTGELL